MMMFMLATELWIVQSAEVTLILVEKMWLGAYVPFGLESAKDCYARHALDDGALDPCREQANGYVTY